MPQLPEPLERLIQELSRLPGIGPKTAQRLAFHLLRVDRQRADSLAQAIEDVKARIGYCERCYNIAEGSLCWICASPRRDASVLCVVESAFDVLAVERTSEYSGLYFALQAYTNPDVRPPLRWSQALGINLTFYYLWALTTPLVVAMNVFRLTTPNASTPARQMSGQCDSAISVV